MKKKIIFIPIAILVVGFLTMQFLATLKKTPVRRTPPPRPKIVDAIRSSQADIQTEIIAYGRLATAQPVVIYSEVSGFLQNGSVPFRPAQSFRKGDLLLKIDDRQIELELNSTKSDLLNALASVLPEIRLDFTDDYQKWQDYFNKITFDQKIPPLPETSSQKIKLFLSRFNVYKLYFAVKNQEIRLEKHFIYAPFNGSIVATDLQVGATARSGTRLGEIISIDDLEVELPIPPQDLQWIDKKSDIILTSAEIRGQWRGSVRRIGKSIDESTQTIQVFLSVDNSAHQQLYDGIFLKATITGSIIADAVSVPQKAIYNDRYVYLIKQGRFDYREIEIARKETDRSIVTAGIQEGDTLVVEVMQGIVPGMFAKPKILDSNGRVEE